MKLKDGNNRGIKITDLVKKSTEWIKKMIEIRKNLNLKCPTCNGSEFDLFSASPQGPHIWKCRGCGCVDDEYDNRSKIIRRR